MIERARRNSILKNLAMSSPVSQSQPQLDPTSGESSTVPNNLNESQINSINNQYTFSPSNYQRRPSIFQTEAIRKMHSAVELNKKILEKSKNASLVCMNIPAPPKLPGTGDYNCKFPLTF